MASTLFTISLSQTTNTHSPGLDLFIFFLNLNEWKILFFFYKSLLNNAFLQKLSLPFMTTFIKSEKKDQVKVTLCTFICM